MNPITILEKLAPLLSEARKQRIEHVLRHRLQSIHLAIEAPSDMHNALAAIRSCEAFGIVNMHIIAAEGGVVGIRAITQGTYYWINLQLHATLNEFLELATQQSWCLVGGVLNEVAAVPLAEVPLQQTVGILLGNEQRGLSERARAACSVLYKIPMVGMAESLNLSVAAALTLYDVTQRKRREGIETDLTESEANELRAKYYLNSVDARVAKNLL